jgi:RNA-binding protein Luc7-like 2
MSAAQMRKMLEQLMGPQDEQAANRHFTDRDVCRSFLLNICINDLFINTREDIGPCGKIHSEALRADFEKESQKKDYRIEEEVLDYLKDFIVKNERKIVTNKKRLEAEESPELEAKAQEMHDLGIQIGEKLAKAETLGNEGKVDESLAMMTEVEELKKKRKDAEVRTYICERLYE